MSTCRTIVEDNVCSSRNACALSDCDYEKYSYSVSTFDNIISEASDPTETDTATENKIQNRSGLDFCPVNGFTMRVTDSVSKPASNTTVTNQDVGKANEYHVNVCSEYCELSCLALNVCGLRTKMLSPDFLHLIENYNVVALSETKLDDLDKICIPGYTLFFKNRQKFKRKSGGILLCIKNTLTDFVTVLESKNRRERIDNSVINKYKFVDADLMSEVLYFKFDKEFLGKEVLFGCVYLPPEGSDYYDRNFLSNMENDVASLNSDAICLLGDFNARTASVPEYSLDNYDDTDEYICSADFSMLPNRNSEDTVVNNMGLSLLNFCNTVEAFIVNGRIGANTNSGKFTSKEASVVDYAIVSVSLLDNVQDFSVLEFCELFSDIHCPISVKLRFEKQINSVFRPRINPDLNANPEKGDNFITRPRWFNDSKEKFCNKLEEYALEIQNLNSTISNFSDSKKATQKEIDDIYENICSILKKTADEIGLYKRKKTKKQKKRQTDELPWFDRECEKKRKLFFKAKNYARRVKNLETKENKKIASKCYKKQLRISFGKYQSNFTKKIRKLKSSDPKNFWKVINGSTQEKKRDNANISCKAFQEHFQKLGATENTDKPTTVQSPNYDTEDETDALFDDAFSEDEVKKVLKKLNNNKACGIDAITNEFLKTALDSDSFLALMTHYFNLVLSSGVVPECWTVGVIKPLYKNKGSNNDPNNYRGISLLSCFGKVFTSLINNRLTTYFDQNNTIGEEQAGFRSDHSVTDHIFVLYAIIDLFLSMKKRLYCIFIDYEKAFDLVNRSFLWQKMLNSGVNGKVLHIVKDMYKKAKSCVQWNCEMSDYFSCSAGVRQGENLSPLLFSIYLNDLKAFLGDQVEGLQTFKNMSEGLDISADYVDILYSMFILLYADDTVIFAESPDSLQNAINAMYDYCKNWDLKMNVSKTKVMIFSRGKIRKLPDFFINGQKVDVTFEFKYLGIKFNYNGSFLPAQKDLCNRANKAMFSLLKKIRSLMLPLDIQLELFEKTVVPILLYGSEVWCPQMTDTVRKLQLRFLKFILKVGKSTPSCMVFGELGQFPLDIQAKCRMLNFWYKMAYGDNTCKFSCIMYKFLLNQYESDKHESSYLRCVKDTLDGLGMSEVWMNQQTGSHLSQTGFQLLVKKKLQDQYIQNWLGEINGNEMFYNYRMFKENFAFEKYLNILPANLAHATIKFRTLNHKMPIQKGRIMNVNRKERLCRKCATRDLGDEFHYLFVCDFFKNERKMLMKSYFYNHPNTIKFAKLLGSHQKTVLLKLSKYMSIVMKNM